MSDLPKHDPSQIAFSVPKAAGRLGIGKSTLWGLIYQGKLKTIRIGTRRLVPDSELQRIVSEAA